MPPNTREVRGTHEGQEQSPHRVLGAVGDGVILIEDRDDARHREQLLGGLTQVDLEVLVAEVARRHQQLARLQVHHREQRVIQRHETALPGRGRRPICACTCQISASLSATRMFEHTFVASPP